MASLEETTGAWPVYIKFNSQPTASSTGQKRGKGSTELLVNINLTLTNDLGEQRHSGDVDLEVLIRAESLNKERVFAVRWDPKQYVLKESLNCGPVSLWSNHASDTPQRIDRLICSIAAKGSAERIKQCHVIDLRRAFNSDETQIISTLSPVRSSDDSPDSSSTYTAWTERCLLLPQLSEQSETRFRQVVLPVPEERGTHLAKHIW